MDNIVITTPDTHDALQRVYDELFETLPKATDEPYIKKVLISSRTKTVNGKPIQVYAIPIPDDIDDKIREIWAARVTNTEPCTVSEQSWQLWQQIIDDAIPHGWIPVTARLADLNINQVSPDWRPTGQQLRAWLNEVIARDSNGKPLMPYHVAQRKVPDLYLLAYAAQEAER